MDEARVIPPKPANASLVPLLDFVYAVAFGDFAKELYDRVLRPTVDPDGRMVVDSVFAGVPVLGEVVWANSRQLLELFFAALLLYAIIIEYLQMREISRAERHGSYARSFVELAAAFLAYGALYYATHGYPVRAIVCFGFMELLFVPWALLQGLELIFAGMFKPADDDGEVRRTLWDVPAESLDQFLEARREDLGRRFREKRDAELELALNHRFRLLAAYRAAFGVLLLVFSAPFVTPDAVSLTRLCLALSLTLFAMYASDAWIHRFVDPRAWLGPSGIPGARWWLRPRG